MTLRKTFFALSLSLCTLLILIVFSSQIEQHIFRHRGERLLAETQALELRKTSWSEALQKFQHWGGAEKFSDICNDHECTVEIHLSEPVYNFVSRSFFFVHLDDYLRWRFRLNYQMGPFVRAENALLHLYLHAGGRPAVVSSFVGMQEGIVWNKEFGIYLETFAHGDPNVWEGVYALSADIRTVSNFSEDESRNPQLTLHSNYVINRPGGCEICVLGWVHFSPYADPIDMKRLMTLNLSCLTRFHPCRTQQDIMPDAWTQFLAEKEQVDKMWGQRVCSEPTTQMLGRDSENLIIGEIVTYNEKLAANEWRGLAGVKLLKKLKGGGNWKVGDTHDMEIFRPPDRTIGVGSKFIFNFDDPTEFDKIPGEAVAHCSPLPLNEANLKLVLQGVAEDYGAGESTSQRQWHW
jgi:hypothetical protein